MESAHARASERPSECVREGARMSEWAWANTRSLQCTNLIAATHCITTTHCNTATHCSTLQHTATPGIDAMHTVAKYGIALQRTARNCKELQHTATHCNTLQHYNPPLYLLYGSQNFCTLYNPPLYLLYGSQNFCTLWELWYIGIDKVWLSFIRVCTHANTHMRTHTEWNANDAGVGDEEKADGEDGAQASQRRCVVS